MKRLRLTRWTASFGPPAAAVALFAAWWPVPEPVMVPNGLPIASLHAEPFSGDTLREFADRASARNPFRLNRRPASVRFDPSGAYPPPPTPPPPPPPPPPKPVLQLVGLIIGGEPSAIVEGLPGHDTGAVLRRGDELAGVTFDLLRGDSVVLRGYDTVWVLGPRSLTP